MSRPLAATEEMATTKVEDAKHDEDASSEPQGTPDAASANEATPLPTESNVAKAASFLRRRDIRDVPLNAKRRYLESKGDMTRDDIDEALERAWKDGTRKGAATAAESGSRRPRDGRADADRHYASQHGHEDRLGGEQGHRRSANNQRYQEDSQWNHRRGPVEHRPPLSHNPMPHDSNAVPAFANSARATEAESFSSFSAVAGGFSLGVFLLASLRWLNGGDFVLFPPPTVAEPRGTECHVGETLTEEEEQEEEKDMCDESVEHDADASGSKEDIGLDAVLNGSAHSQGFRANDAQHVNHDLVLEIRGLAAAIHSHRDAQERATRAAAARVGKELTDDVMDGLREKRTDLDAASSPQTARGFDTEISTLAALLSEVLGDLCLLEQGILQQNAINEKNQSTDSEDANVLDMTVKDDEHVRNEKAIDSQDGAKNGKEKKDASDVIDDVKEKVKKMSNLVQSIIDSNGKRSSVSPAIENGSKSVTPETNVQSTASSSMPHTETDKDTQQCENGVPRTDALLEDALATLANNNDAASLKVGAQMLYLYCLNISKNPSVPRYRKIYTNNGTFRNKVGNLEGAKEVLSAMGFTERANFFEWSESEDATPATQSRLDFALLTLEMMKNGSTSGETMVPSEGKRLAPKPPKSPLSGSLVKTGDDKGTDLK